MKGIINEILPLLHFGFGRSASLNDGNAAGQLGQPLFQFFAIVIAGGRINLLPDLLGSTVDLLLLAGAFDDKGVILVDHNALGRSEIGKLNAFQLQTKVFADEFTTGDDGEIAHHRLAAIAETRGFDRTNIQYATQLVHHERSQCLGFNILGNDQQRPPGGNHFIQQRQQLRQI